MKITPLVWIVGIIIAIAVLIGIDAALQPLISVLFRSSMVGLGKVMVLTNTSDKTLHEVTVTGNNSRTHDRMKRIVAVTLEPHRSIEVGWMQTNWAFSPGESFSVGASGYPSNVGGSVPK